MVRLAISSPCSLILVACSPVVSQPGGCQSISWLLIVWIPAPLQLLQNAGNIPSNLGPPSAQASMSNKQQMLSLRDGLPFKGVDLVGPRARFLAALAYIRARHWRQVYSSHAARNCSTLQTKPIRTCSCSSKWQKIISSHRSVNNTCVTRLQQLEYKKTATFIPIPGITHRSRARRRQRQPPKI